jgi:hypothetical protein
MKKIIFKTGATLFIVAVIITSCASPAEKVENAQNGVTQANNALDKANQAYLADIETSKREADARAAANDSSIARFRARIATEKQETKDAYEKKIAELDQKNRDMKKEMDDYKADGQDNWDKFKSKFSEESNAFAESVKDFMKKRGM